MLVYGNEEIWGDPAIDFAALVKEVDAFNTALKASGEMVAVEEVLRELGPQVLGALVRRHGDFARCVAAVQAHLLEAAGEPAAAARAYRQAAAAATNVPERRFLALRAARLERGQDGAHDLPR